MASEKIDVGCVANGTITVSSEELLQVTSQLSARILELEAENARLTKFVSALETSTAALVREHDENVQILGDDARESRQRYEESEEVSRAWREWSRTMLKTTLPTNAHSEVQSASDADVRGHLGRVTMKARCAGCVPQYDCFTRPTECVKFMDLKRQAGGSRSMFAKFIEPHDRHQPVTPGALVSVQVPITCTVHSWDTLKMNHVLELGRSVADAWASAGSVQPQLLTRFAEAVRSHNPERDETLPALRLAIRSLRNAMGNASDWPDWETTNRHAWIYGVIIGWLRPSDLRRVAERHHWKARDLERLERYRNVISTAVAE